MKFLEKVCLFVLVILLPAQLGYHSWPDWSLVNGVRVDYFSPTIYLTDVVIGALFLLSKKTYLKPRVLLTGFFLALVNVLGAQSAPLATYKWLRLLEYVWLSHYIYYHWHSNKHLCSVGLQVSVVWTCILAWAQTTLQHSVGGFWYWVGERTFSLSTPGIAKIAYAGQLVLRPYATLPHPNALAAFLLLATIIIWPVLKDRQKFFNLWLAFPLITIILSGSRSVLAGLVIWLISLMWLKTKTAYLKAALIILLFVCVLSIPFLPHNPDSTTERLWLSQSALNIFQKHVLTGAGLGNFISANASFLSGPQDFRLALQPVHSIYLLFLSEVGLVGILVISWVIVRNGQKLWAGLSSYWRVALVMVLGLGLVDHYWLTLHQTSLVLAIFFGVVVLQSTNYGELNN